MMHAAETKLWRASWLIPFWNSMVNESHLFIKQKVTMRPQKTKVLIYTDTNDRCVSQSISSLEGSHFLMGSPVNNVIPPSNSAHWVKVTLQEWWGERLTKEKITTLLFCKTSSLILLNYVSCICQSPIFLFYIFPIFCHQWVTVLVYH